MLPVLQPHPDESGFEVFLSAATAIPSSPAPLLAVGVDVAVELAVDATPVAVDVDVPVTEAAPAVFVLAFEPAPPAPPAPPARLTEVVLVAELVCDTVAEFELVLLPEFVPVAAFDVVFAPWFTSSPSAVAANASASTAAPARNVV
jgi:hypothetical protein